MGCVFGCKWKSWKRARKSVIFLGEYLLGRALLFRMDQKKRRRSSSSRKPNTIIEVSSSREQQFSISYEGESLACLLKSIDREMEVARLVDTGLPPKIWLKQQFSIGVNDVTRVLERMPPVAVKGSSPPLPPSPTQPLTSSQNSCSDAPSVQLQAILLASDCNPRWLTRHLPTLAASRKVPLIFVKDKKGGSIRLGELVKLKTAMAIGVKVKGNAVNQLIEQVLHDKEIIVG